MTQNVFEDLGFPAEEARDLKERATAMGAIRTYVKEHGYSEQKVAEMTGLSEDEVSGLLGNKIDLFSMERLRDIASRIEASSE